jgi:hypothetical protein
MKRENIKINLLTNFNKAGGEDINEEIINLVNNCKSMINGLEEQNDYYVKEVKSFIIDFQKVFEENYPSIHLDPSNIEGADKYLLGLADFIKGIKSRIRDGIVDTTEELDHIVINSARKTKQQLIKVDDVRDRNSVDLQAIMLKNRKLHTSSFFQQLYLIKEKGILSQTYFSKSDSTMSSNFCEAVCYFHITEKISHIKTYLQAIKRMFRRYVILYRQDLNKNFTKVIVTGITEKQTKRKLVKFVMKNVRQNCMIKFSNYNKLKTCFDIVYPKLIKKNYVFYTNFSDEKLSTLLKNK